MSKVKKFLKSPAAAVLALLLAAGLLLFSGISSARAVLLDPSQWFTSRVQMEDIGISLLENGNIVSHRNYNSAADGTWDQDCDTIDALDITAFNFDYTDDADPNP